MFELFCIYTMIAFFVILIVKGIGAAGKVVNNSLTPAREVQSKKTISAEELENIMAENFLKDFYKKYPWIKETEDMSDEDTLEYLKAKYEREGHL